ncbi:MAG: ATP-binding protein, partial [Candidatus Limnocylindria bacterium]
LDTLPAGVGLRDLGLHRLKDLSRPERLYQLDIDGLPSEFPPPRTLDRVKHNLPVQLTSFVGREKEVAAGRRLLMGTRLLSLVGPGGTGKTRLSLQLAAESIDDFADGVFFVGLAPVSEPELVPSAIAAGLGVRLAGNRTPLDQVAEHLRELQTLLVLDNFEQVVASAPKMAELLRACPRVKVLVTTRTALRVSGEQEFPVPPLALPDVRHLPEASALSQYEAVRLFIERALAAKPDFAVTNENAPAVAGICAALDGLPLAIELAAARVKVLSPEAILTRLEKSFSVLSGAPMRDLPARQQTLRGAIDWSYELLEPGARRLFERLSVFTGGGRLAEIEAVCGPAEEIGGEVLDTISSLVDQSLLRQRDEGGEPRFVMLRVIREYALERLEAGVEAAEIRRRHARTYVDIAERAAPHLTTAAQKEWLDRLDREHDNLRAAVEWLIAAEDNATAGRLLFAMWRFWQMRGHLREGQARAERILALPVPQVDPVERARALEAAGGLAYWMGDMPAARAMYAEALDLVRRTDDRAAIANAEYNLAFTHIVPSEDLETARALLEEAREGWTELGDHERARLATWGLAGLYLSLGDFAAARRAAQEVIPAFRSSGRTFDLGWAVHILGMGALHTGDAAEARQWLAEGLAIFVGAEDQSGIVVVLRDIAELELKAGERPRAMRIAGASRALEDSSGAGIMTVMMERPAGIWTPIHRDELPAAERAAWDEGTRMSAAEAVAYAVREPD